MNNVRANASGGISSNMGVYNSASSSPIMTNVIATASGGTAAYGVVNSSSSTIMTHVTATASEGGTSYGVLNDNASSIVKINHSVIKGTTYTINNISDAKTYIGNTQLDGGVVQNSGTLTCVGVYNGTYTALNSTCQ
jgi:hypothetical protein